MSQDSSAPSNPASIAVTIPQAARLLNITVSAVRHLIWSGKIRHAKVGKRFLISPVELREYFERQLVRL